MDDGPTLAFGTLLRRARRMAGMTQADFAERAGVSVRAISDLERGVRHMPHTDTVALLVEALDLQDAELAALMAAAGRLRRREMAPVAGARAQGLFVGRQHELALLERHLAGEGPPVLLLAGEPGIGKTRLLRATVPRAEARGWRVLDGGCQRRGGQEPYAPLLEALERHLRSATPAQRRADLDGCTWLARLLPELAEVGTEPLPLWTLPAEQERRLMFKAAGRLLANVAGSEGTLLLLDDLQWAGADALDLLATLARTASETRLRILGAYRDTEVHPEDPLALLLADLAQAGLAAHRVLAPLPPPEAAELLDKLLVEMGAAEESTLRAAVLRRTGGVPFFLVSCAQGLGLQDHEGTAYDTVPWDVAQGVRQRVAMLPLPARELVGAAAVVGRLVPRALVAEVLARPEPEVLAALAAACRARLLEEVGDDAYQFTHDIIHELVRADLGAAQRAVLHRQVAAALERRPAKPPVELLAYHYARSDRAATALPYLSSAAEQARRIAAHQEEAALLAQAIDLAAKVGRTDLLGELHARRGTALTHMTRWSEARDAMQAALSHVPQDRGELRAEILTEMAKACIWGFSDAPGIRRYATEALVLAEECGSEDLAVAALSALVTADAADGQLQTGIARYRQAAARAGNRYAPRLAVGAQFAGLMHYWLADYDTAILRAREAIALGRAAYDSSTVARAQGDLGCALLGSGRYVEALQVFSEGQQESREQGAIDWLARTTLMRGGLHFELFDFAGAEALALEARDLSRSAQLSASPEVSAALDLLLNYARRGDTGRAEALVDETFAAVAKAQGAHGWLWKLRFAQAQAEIALGRGDYEIALQHARDVVAGSRTRGRVKYEVAGLQVQAQALALQGRTREAVGHLQSAVARARGTGDPAMFLRAAAALLAIDGDAALLAEARAAVERIAGSLPESALRQCFLAAEPVRLVTCLPDR